MNPEFAIQLALLIPLVAAGITLLFSQRPNLRDGGSIVAGIALFAVVASLAPHVFSGGRPMISTMEMVPGLAIAFQVEPLGMLFALVASSLWIVTTCYSIGYMRGHHEKNQTRFFACFAIAIFAAMGAAMSQNMLTLFVFYEILTLSTFPLVAHHGTEAARKGSRTYLSLLLFTSVTFLLLAVAWTWSIAGTLDFRVGGILTGKASNTVLMAFAGALCVRNGQGRCDAVSPLVAGGHGRPDSG